MRTTLVQRAKQLVDAWDREEYDDTLDALQEADERLDEPCAQSVGCLEMQSSKCPPRADKDEPPTSVIEGNEVDREERRSRRRRSHPRMTPFRLPRRPAILSIRPASRAIIG